MEQTIIIILSVLLLAAGAASIYLATRKKEQKDPLADNIQKLSELVQVSSTRYEAIEKSLHNQSNQFSQRLDTITQTVGQRLDTASEAVKGLEVKMVKVQEAASKVLEVGKDISSLQQILKAPKLRGGIGEQLLKDLLSQMLPEESFDTEYSFSDGERVDAIIKTSQGIVPIDSKLPIEAFQRLVAETNSTERIKKRKEFARDARKHVDAIANKYIRPTEGTFDFALMYVPAENIYYEMIATEKGSDPLSTYALTKKVIPVSPNTFYAYLHTILIGLRGMKLEKHVKDIINQLGQLKNKLGQFQESFDLVGKHMSNASNAYTKADKKLSELENGIARLEEPQTIDSPPPHKQLPH